MGQQYWYVWVHVQCAMCNCSRWRLQVCAGRPWSKDDRGDQCCPRLEKIGGVGPEVRGSATDTILAGPLCGVKSTAAHPLSRDQSDGKAIWPARQVGSPCLQKASVYMMARAWVVSWSAMLRGELCWRMLSRHRMAARVGLSILSDAPWALWYRAARADLPTRPKRCPMTKLHFIPARRAVSQFICPCSRH